MMDISKYPFVISSDIEIKDVESEDGGQFKMVVLEDDQSSDCFYIRLCSWDEARNHTEFNGIVGKRVRVTVEVID